MALCFSKDAESLYREEAVADSIANVAATVLLGMAFEIAGQDSLGQKLLSASRHMGEREGSLESHQMVLWR